MAARPGPAPDPVSKALSSLTLLESQRSPAQAPSYCCLYPKSFFVSLFPAFLTCSQSPRACVVKSFLHSQEPTHGAGRPAAHPLWARPPARDRRTSSYPVSLTVDLPLSVSNFLCLEGQSPGHWPRFHFIISLKCLSPSWVTFGGTGVRVSTQGFWRGYNSNGKSQ